MKKTLRSMFAMVMCLVLVAVMFAGCVQKTPGGEDGTTNKPAIPTQPTTPPEEGVTTPPEDDGPVIPAVFKQAEYNTTTVVMPSNWNKLTYKDNNDTQILSYIGSSFFDYDYKFEGDKKYNKDGSINVDGIVKDAYTTNYSAATKLEDVTATVASKWGYTDAQKAEGGYAWKITLRNDLMWDDGTPITAADFVYSMQAQLDPAFMNFRGNLYYDTLMIKNSRGYFFQNQEGTYESVASQGYESNQAALDAGEILFVDIQALDADLFGGSIGYGTLVDENGKAMPQYIAYNDTTLFNTPEGWETGSEDYLFSVDMVWPYIAPNGPYAQYCEPGGGYNWVAIYRPNTVRNVAWEDVGIYAEGNAIVICLDKAYSLLKEDGSLSWQAPYYLSSLPLVHKVKYEANKHEPAEGATLWTTTYNTDLASTASWGPYKLERFEAGSDYRLVKNDKWYGWNMEEYKNQYNITAINCVKIEEAATQWMGFLAGQFDDSAFDTFNINDYLYSKYVTYVPDTGTFGMQLYSNLPVLKASDNNNGILAIQQFRHAFNLSLNRTDIIEQIWPGTATPCLGLLNSMYYYDIENAPLLPDGGSYRNTIQAQEGLLRAYGFVQAEDGTWSSGSLTGLTTEEASMSLTGYNPNLAKEKLKEAIAILQADPEYYGYDASQKITLVYGSSQDTEKQRFRANYLQDVLNELTKGTALEGQIVVEFDASAGSEWAEAFRAGDTQIGFGYGFSGNAFNPFDIMGAFVNPDDDLNYHQYWDTSSENMTLTMPAGDYEGAGKQYTMSIQNWFFCLNGLAGVNDQKYTFNWGDGYAPASVRLMILSALEERAILENRSIMLIGDYTGSFLGAKFSNFAKDYNTFMGYGGLRYMVVEYTDAEWDAFVEANGNDLSAEYKKSE